MLQPTLVAEHRRQPRVQLSLSARLRWLTPLGPFTVLAETLDVCRGGLLVRLGAGAGQPCRRGIALWVTFPFDAATEVTQPETPARVARVEETPDGGHRAGLEFVALPKHQDAPAPPVTDRRHRERFSLALPIRVRLPSSPWHEEAMTVNLSGCGVLFCTPRLYQAGETMLVTLPPAGLGSGWAAFGEAPARIVRVEKDGRGGSTEQQVALALLPAGTGQAPD